MVEFTKAGSMSVQRGTAALTGTTTTATIALPAAVDPTKTFVLASFRSSATSTGIGRRLLRARLTSSTTLELSRSASGAADPITEILYEVVELRDGAASRCGTSSFASGAASATASLSPAVDLRRATATLTVQHGSGQNAGQSSYTSDDVVGAGAFTASLTATQLRLDRAFTSGTADAGWCVVEWGR